MDVPVAKAAGEVKADKEILEEVKKDLKEDEAKLKKAKKQEEKKQ